VFRELGSLGEEVTAETDICGVEGGEDIEICGIDGEDIDICGLAGEDLRGGVEPETAIRGGVDPATATLGGVAETATLGGARKSEAVFFEQCRLCIRYLLMQSLHCSKKVLYACTDRHHHG
jgi:hypothetical protein